MGFGWNFYGFFLVAAVWVLAYYVWAHWQNREETRDADGVKGKNQPPPAPDSQGVNEP